MKADVQAKHFNERLPRYTSYPTAPHFSPAVSATQYDAWLASLAPGTAGHCRPQGGSRLDSARHSILAEGAVAHGGHARGSGLEERWQHLDAEKAREPLHGFPRCLEQVLVAHEEVARVRAATVRRNPVGTREIPDDTPPRQPSPARVPHLLLSRCEHREGMADDVNDTSVRKFRLEARDEAFVGRRLLGPVAHARGAGQSARALSVGESDRDERRVQAHR